MPRLLGKRVEAVGLAGRRAVPHPRRPGQGKSRVGLSRALTTREPLRTFARVKEIPSPYRREGDLFAQRDRDDPKAEKAYQRALVLARERGAKSFELRAATSLARLLHGQHRFKEGRDLLEPIYGWFTEGFDTADLKDARALLEGLSP